MSKKIYSVDITAPTFKKSLVAFDVTRKQQTGWNLTREDGEKFFTHVIAIKDNYFFDETIAKIEYMTKNNIDSFTDKRLK